MASMLEIEDLTKRFGPVVAVDHVSFTADRGEVLGFLGPNGAGKSTTMKVATGFLPPTSGRVRVCGHDIAEQAIEAQRRIGYLPEGAPLYEDMTPFALLNFVGEVRGMARPARRNAIERAAGLINLAGVMYQPIETLSKGFKRRVGLALALLHDPDVLILDEPTDGLDPNQKHEVRELIARMAADKAIVISTHILEEVEAVCSRAIIIARGRIVADGKPAELAARSRWHNAVSIRLKADKEAAAQALLQSVPGVDRVETVGRVNGVAHLMAFPADGRVIINEVSEKVRTGDFAVEEIRIERGHLDEVFRDITTRA